MKTEIQGQGASPTFTLDRPVAGLENAIGKFFLGRGPGPEGPAKQIPLLFQVLDPRTFALGYKPGDPGYQVLSNDQNRFALPKALPPLLTLLEPGDDDNPDGCHLVARYAYSEKAFLLLHDLLGTGFRFTLKEFLKLSQALCEVLAFLHSQSIVHGQWNPRSVLCIPEPSSGSPFEESTTYRYHVLNTGVRFHDALAIPKEFLERGYFPREIFSPQSQLPDYEAYDLEADVYCLAACLKDIFQRASCFEELTTQATKIRDHFHREAIRRGQEPNPDRIRHKEQEILDHLYTFKVKAEEMIQSGLRERGERANSSSLWERARDLYQKTSQYAEKLLQVGFAPVNIFGDDLQRYVPYQIKLEPRFVNSFNDTIVTLSGVDLPHEVVRVTLGETNTPMELLDGGPTRIRFRVPRGFKPGQHPILINNQRTSDPLKVIAPTWKHVLPDKARKPWTGFGNIAVRVVGRDLPSSPYFALLLERGAPDEGAPEWGEARESGPAEVEACLVHPETAQEGAQEQFVVDERVSTEDEVYLVEFPPHAPVGKHHLRCKGLDTGLRLSIEDVLPVPILDREGMSPVEVLNHREQIIHLRGRHFHESMVVDLGEAAPAGAVLHFQGERAAVLTLPAGFAAGEYPVRVNHTDSGLRLRVREPRWSALEPKKVVLGGRREKPRELVLSGQDLPGLDDGSKELYRFRNVRGREVPQGVVRSEEIEPGTAHRLRVSPQLHRGAMRLFFDGRDTGLQLRVQRKLSPAVRSVTALAALLVLAGAGYLIVEQSRPRIHELLTARLFSFRDPIIQLAGERLTGVLLEDEKGRKVRELKATKLPEPAAGKRALYAASASGVPAGSYRVVPIRRFLRGKPAATPLELASPRFDLSPRMVNRLLPAELALGSGGRFPIKDLKTLTLKRRAVRADAAPEKATDKAPDRVPEKAADQVDGALLTLVKADSTPAKAETAAARPEKALAKAETAPAKAAAGLGLDSAFSFPIGAGGKVQLKTGTFAREAEGEYEVLLDGLPLPAVLTADSNPLVVRVVGPRAVALSPNPVTLSEAGTIQVALKGEDLPAGIGLGLVREGVKHEIAFPLKAGAKGLEGAAEAGKFLAAWDCKSDTGDGGKPEVIPGVALEVYPPPRVTEVSPATAEPDRPVELTLRGVNLREARFFSLKPLGRSEEGIRVAMEPERLRQEGASPSEYQTGALVFSAGTYAITPGGEAVLEVIEDCKKLLDAYRKDLGGRDRLLECLAGRHAGEEARRMAADVFFDQGLLAESLGLYRKLDDLKSRFRAAFISLHGNREGQPADGAGGPARFSPRADDPQADPYFRAAAALGWIAGVPGSPAADPSSTWDLDFVRGSLAEDPRVAVESLELSIEKKRRAAVVKEIAPFAPAQEALAAARLRLSVAELKAGDPARVREQLRSLFFESGEAYQLLPPAERARACFYYGHTTFWTSLDEEKAAQVFQQGLKDGESADHATLCRLYLAALGTAPAAGQEGAAAGPGWEGSFILVLKHYRHVQKMPNYNILTEKYDFGSPLYPEERKASLELHQAMKRLESATEVMDPFAHHALLFSLRNAQLLSWPRQEGGLKAGEHREKLRGLNLKGEAALLRDFHILWGEVEPLEKAQLTLLDPKVAQASSKRVSDLLRGGLREPVHARLKLLEKKLQRY